MLLHRLPALLLVFSTVGACQVFVGPTVVLSQVPSMTFATPEESSPSMTPAPTGVGGELPGSGALIPNVIPSDSGETPATLPVVVDVPILPLETETEPFPDLPHVGDLSSVCDLFTRGAAQVVRAVLPESEEIPGEVRDDGRRYEVELGDAGSGFEGRVVFQNTRTAVYGFYLSADVPLEAFLDGMTPLALQSSQQNPAGCTQVAVYHFVEILPGEVTLNFGPGTVDRLSLVIERAQEANP